VVKIESGSLNGKPSYSRNFFPVFCPGIILYGEFFRRV